MEVTVGQHFLIRKKKKRNKEQVSEESDGRVIKKGAVVSFDVKV